MFCLNYLFVGFIVRDISSSFAVWKNVYFVGHFIIIIPLILDAFGLGKFIKSKFHPKIKDE
jgi:hypothetical protein